MNVSVIIPSLNPDDKLIKVVEALLGRGFSDIIIVNDGSNSKHMEPFWHIQKYSQCHILNHEVNKGKGRALKTAFEYCISHRKQIDGVVTVDGDNQHRVEDISNCVNVMLEKKSHVILGTRDFSGNHIPTKSKFGNNMTSFIFKYVCGLNISDTQTGLRAIPFQYLRLFTTVQGERFEFETNMLLELRHSSIPFTQVRIRTIYIEENASTHFNPIIDSLKIYRVILKFIFSSILSSVIDLGVFTIISFWLLNKMDKSEGIFISTILARIISSLFNYSVNKKAVFHSQNSVRNSFIKYYLLCICQMLISYFLVYGITGLFTLNSAMTVAVKGIVDTILFFISFKIQKGWVFKRD